MEPYNKFKELKGWIENHLKQMNDLQEYVKKLEKEMSDEQEDYPYWANWEAIDLDGEYWYYEKEPKIDVEEGFFRQTGGVVEYIGTRPTLDWTKSLKRIER